MTVQVVKPTLPPETLVRPCPVPYRAVNTTGELVNRLTATEGALAVCTAQVDNIRRWRNETLAEFTVPN